jgi:hypothetical protein
MILCGLCVLGGELLINFTTEDTEDIEKIGSERRVFPLA